MKEIIKYVRKDGSEGRIELDKFVGIYCDHYEDLYRNRDRHPGYTAAIAIGDGFLASKEADNRDFVSAFCQARGDIISSDREAAAFGLALVQAGVV